MVLIGMILGARITIFRGRLRGTFRAHLANHFGDDEICKQGGEKGGSSLSNNLILLMSYVWSNPRSSSPDISPSYGILPHRSSTSCNLQAQNFCCHAIQTFRSITPYHLGNRKGIKKHHRNGILKQR